MFWLFWLLKWQDTFMVVSQKITIKGQLLMISSFKSWELFKFKYVIFIADLYTLHHIQKICRQYMNHCNLCSSSMNFCFLTSVIKQEGAKWAKWNCWAHMFMGFILTFGKVRKYLKNFLFKKIFESSVI